MLTIRVPSIKCSRFHSQETEDSIDGNDSPGGGAELCPPDFVFVVMTRRILGVVADCSNYDKLHSNRFANVDQL